VVSVGDVKRLREETGAGVMDAKRALDRAEGDFERARRFLREEGIAAAAKRSDRNTGEGVIESYIHGDGRIGVLVELNSETDFAARTEQFRELAHDVAMQVAAMDPAGLTVDDLSEDIPEAERPQRALLTQTFIKDADKTIQQLVEDTISTTGENIRISRFIRFEVGGDPTRE
jgi:elongation factor Ts